MTQTDLIRAVEAILFAAGEPVSAARMALALDCSEQEVHQAAQQLADQLSFDRRGIRVVRLEQQYQMCSSAEMSALITRALETRKPPKLSNSLLETLTVIAYYQPVTKTYVEQIRGVDSGYSGCALLTRGLIEECCRLKVPGRPILYRTTPDFLRTFGLQSLEDLPEITLMSAETAQEAAQMQLELPLQEAQP